MQGNRWRLPFLAFLWGSFVGAISIEDLSSEQIAPEEQQLQARIAQLVADLGDPRYSQRARARKELEDLGLTAFDALHAAQTHANSEIAMAARFLLRSLSVLWIGENDAPEVRSVLEGYGHLPSQERLSRMQRLKPLNPEVAIPVWVRLARFETDLRLSREAALLALSHSRIAQVDDPTQLATTIRNVLGTNQRPTSTWLRVLAKEIETGQLDEGEWLRLIEHEQSRVHQGAVRDTDAQIVFGLYRATAERMARRGDPEKADKFALAGISTVATRSQDVLEAVQWAAQNSFWSSILRLAEDRQESFHKHAQLRYFQAWAVQRLGDSAQAERLAQQALEMTPLADLSSRTEIGPIDEATHQSLDEHFRNGVFLHESGMQTWAEREFQRIIQRAPVWAVRGVEARSYYVMQILKDQARYQEAADTLLPLVERVEQDGTFRKNLIGTRGLARPDDFRVEMDYCRAMSLRDKDPEQARKFFRSSLQADPSNPDTLIGMFELPGDPSWRTEVETEIAAATEKLEAKIRQEENARRASESNLVIYYNNYAWLVANTVGDQELALKRAKKAVDLAPDSGGELDTYARCLFRNGRLEEAIAIQTRACELLPQSAQLKRQLELFKQSRSPSP